MKEERDALLRMMKETKVKKGKKLLYHGEALDNEYYVGKIGKKEIVLCRCGVGQLYAALSTNLLIEKFKPELIINLGVAGSLSEDVHVSDLVVSDKVANWRFDVPGWDRNEDSYYCSFNCDERVTKIVSKLKMENVHCGLIVTGDEFIYKKSQVKEIKRFYPRSLCGEMEGYAIAGTAYAHGIPVSIIRSISDETLVSGNFKQFDFNLESVCEKAATLCKEVIKRY
ncbi:MAG: 5'-methylthioadenosine/S-adenosylhomocysteine nucleosidase [Erysipelotrichaceae bacterium]|nr:5'-methylthioadenosine/S-adenosylhomocysteine nucleosidase [Erysipelotrichaceae bacterium]